MESECDLCGDMAELTAVNNIGDLCKDCYEEEMDDKLD